MWRPRVRIAVENIDKVEEEAKDASLKTKGTKRKRAPPHKGPCEHGVKSVSYTHLRAHET